MPLDFGSVGQFGSSTYLEHDNIIWGTPGYMSPQMLLDGKAYGKAVYKIDTSHIDTNYTCQLHLPSPRAGEWSSATERT